MTSVAADVARAGVEHDPAVAHADEPVRPAPGEFDLVQAGDDRQPLLLADLEQQRHHGGGRLGVERGDRLVGEQHRRPLHEGPRDRDPLLLAAGQRVRTLERAVGEADALQVGERVHAQGTRVGQHARTGEPDPAERARQHVLHHREPADQPELLEYEPDAAAQLAHLAAAGARDLAAEHLDRARRGRDEAVERAQQRGLARPGCAEDGEHLPGGHRQVDRVKRAGLREVLGDLVQADGGIGGPVGNSRTARPGGRVGRPAGRRAALVCQRVHEMGSVS